MNGDQRLPIDISDLLNLRVVEKDRIEFKESWNAEPIVRTLCAFANDFQNIGGGYIVIGVASEEGLPAFPPKGVPRRDLDAIQLELERICNLIQPAYFPRLSIETFEGATVVVLWAPGGQNRPYKAPKQPFSKTDKQYRHFIRHFASTVEAKDQEFHELIKLTATVPFDDRINHDASLQDLKLPLLQGFLREVKSGLLESSGSMPFRDLCRQMHLVDGSDEYLKPRNVGLLFFHDRPERFFPLARIELVNFIDGVGGNDLRERIFAGPVQQQLRDCLSFLRNSVVEEHVAKRPDRAPADRFFNFPYAAIEEALVNAVYHRSYEEREPIEVRINPDCIEILSFPGPDTSIRTSNLNDERIVARRYRNRRVGDLLKELKLTEGRGTGIPKIRRALADNGSPPPFIETNDERSFFLIRIPIHPAFQRRLPSSVGYASGDGLTTPVRVVQPRVTVDAFGMPFHLTGTMLRILALCKDAPQTARAIAAELGYGGLTGNLRNALKALRDAGFLEYTLPGKPNSRLQQYITTSSGDSLVVQEEVQVEVQDQSQTAVTTTSLRQLALFPDVPAAKPSITSILRYCLTEARSAYEIARHEGLSEITSGLRNMLRQLRDSGYLAYTVPDKPNSRLQRYLATPKGARDLPVDLT